jgi:hypothetical protein
MLLSEMLGSAGMRTLHLHAVNKNVLYAETFLLSRGLP